MEFGVAFSSASVRGQSLDMYLFILEIRREESCTYWCGDLCGMRLTSLLILLLDRFNFSWSERWSFFFFRRLIFVEAEGELLLISVGGG